MTAPEIFGFSPIPSLGGDYMPNRYDHRLRNAIVETGNVNLFPELSIPPSTARDWIRKGQANVITASEFECTQTEMST